MSHEADLPFLPYGRQTINERDIEAVVEALRAPFLTTGPRVAAFEEAIAEHVDARFGVAISNGTAALHAMCDALNLAEDAEVIVPAVTFLATANSVLYVGARPVFADVDPESGLMTPESFERAITPKTAAVIPVHLAGNPVDMKGIKAVAQRHQIRVIEDAAHAVGAREEGGAIGACLNSEMASFSFHPVKHITTGEGGMVMTNDERLADRLRRFRSHGMTRDRSALSRPDEGPWYYEQHHLGYNYRITDLQCALGLSQLSQLDSFITRRRLLADYYDQRLLTLDWVRPIQRERAGCLSAYHLYAVLIDEARLGIDKRTLVQRLSALKVGTQVHYIPLPMQPFYQALGWSIEDFPGALSYYRQTLSLPLFPSMTFEDVDRVIDALNRCASASPQLIPPPS
jgi:perosamine synthetase